METGETGIFLKITRYAQDTCYPDGRTAIGVHCAHRPGKKEKRRSSSASSC